MKYLFYIVLACLSFKGFAQTSLASGDKTMQFSGYISPFVNFRIYDNPNAKKDKDRFNLDFAVFRIDGMMNKHIHYQLQTNIPALFSTDPTDEFLMQATVEYRTRKDNFNVQAGYDKIPFSRSSMLPQVESPFLGRPEVVRGGTFYRRDMGFTLEKNFFNKRLNAYAGVYNGMGNLGIAGDNDNSGKFMYAARIEASYPARMRYSEMDWNHSPIPIFSVGVDGLYTEKSKTTGSDYPMLTVDGKKQGYSGDFSIMYKGFGFFAEWVGFRITPNDKTILFGKPTNYYLAQGVSMHVNYCFTKWKTMLAVRYDEFNPNDLILSDNRETISYAINYLLDGTNSFLKLQYYQRLKADGAAAAWNDDQIRLAWIQKF